MIYLGLDKTLHYQLRVRAEIRLAKAQCEDPAVKAELAEILNSTNVTTDRLKALVDSLEKKP